jgi:putative N-acetyltransferase (TIGR04045 family)
MTAHDPTSFVDVRVARAAADLAAHHRVREAVFVAEQGIFDGDDRDEWDGTAVKVVASIGDRVVGAVRLYPLDEAGLWKGDRLAVLPEARTLGVGAPLVRFAVHTAGAHGGRRMIALIQRPNVAFFRRLGWSGLGDATLFHGATHQEMTIALSGAQPAFSPAGLAWALGSA